MLYLSEIALYCAAFLSLTLFYMVVVWTICQLVNAALKEMIMYKLDSTIKCPTCMLQSLPFLEFVFHRPYGSLDYHNPRLDLAETSLFITW